MLTTVTTVYIDDIGYYVKYLFKVNEYDNHTFQADVTCEWTSFTAESSIGHVKKVWTLWLRFVLR